MPPTCQGYCTSILCVISTVVKSYCLNCIARVLTVCFESLSVVLGSLYCREFTLLTTRLGIYARDICNTLGMYGEVLHIMHR